MKTPTKQRPPMALLWALAGKPTAKRVFQNMRPSCQQRYAAPVQRAEDLETRKKRVATALHGIIKYGNVHPRLKSKNYRKRV